MCYRFSWVLYSEEVSSECGLFWKVSFKRRFSLLGIVGCWIGYIEVTCLMNMKCKLLFVGLRFFLLYCIFFGEGYIVRWEWGWEIGIERDFGVWFVDLWIGKVLEVWLLKGYDVFKEDEVIGG